MMAVCLAHSAVIGTGLLLTSRTWIGIPSARINAWAGSAIAEEGQSVKWWAEWFVVVEVVVRVQ